MSSYSSSAGAYRTVDEFSNTVTTDAIGFTVDNNNVGLARFTGLTAVLAGATITSATLTLTGWAYSATPSTDEILTVEAYLGDDLALPADWTAFGALPSLTTADANTGSLNGLSTKDVDVKTIIEELVANQGGDVAMFLISNGAYAGTGLDRVTAALAITYTGGGGSAFPWHYYARQRA